MGSVAILYAAMTAGLQVWSDGIRLVVRGPTRLSPLAQGLLAQKAAVIDAWELWHERVAIMELEGGLSCDEAERQAWACLGIMDSPERTKGAAA